MDFEVYRGGDDTAAEIGPVPAMSVLMSARERALINSALEVYRDEHLGEDTPDVTSDPTELAKNPARRIKFLLSPLVLEERDLTLGSFEIDLFRKAIANIYPRATSDFTETLAGMTTDLDAMDVALEAAQAETVPGSQTPDGSTTQ